MRRVSFFTICMNRLHHLRRTFEVNMPLLQKAGVEWLILDYGSRDPVYEWLMAQKNPFLRVIRTNKPKHFLHAHAGNVAGLATEGEIICAMGADNYLAQDFLDLVLRLKPGFFIKPPRGGSCAGRIAMYKTDFIRVGGYDERMQGWGAEDHDLITRFEGVGLTPLDTKGMLLQAIEHGDDERVANLEDKELHHTHHVNDLIRYKTIEDKTWRANPGRLWGQCDDLEEDGPGWYKNWSEIGFYCWDDGFNNLGDAPLNRYLIPKLFPHLRPQKPSKFLMMGIGSILGHHNLLLPEHKELPWLVFGSGYQPGYGELRWPLGSVFCALRGQKTADELQTMCPLGDPAVLLPLYLPKTVDTVPGKTMRIWKWDWTGPETELECSTRAPILEKWLEERLWPCEKIETDSLHAAILADAYGIPWHPLRWEFKWQDHFSGLGRASRPPGYELSSRTLLDTMQCSLLRARDALISFVEGGM